MTWTMTSSDDIDKALLLKQRLIFGFSMGGVKKKEEYDTDKSLEEKSKSQVNL